MAKFAVLLFAALAFQAAFAGVHRHHQEVSLGDYEYGQLEGYKSGQFEQLVGQIQTVAHGVSESLQTAFPENKQVIKTLTWQSRELAQIIDTIINRLHAEAHNFTGKFETVFEKVISELREIQTSLQQIATYTDATSTTQIKKQLNTYVQHAVAQIEKLCMIVSEETQGNLHFVIKSVLNEFYNGLQTIYYQIQEIAEGNFDQSGKVYGYGYEGKYGKGYGFGYAGQYGKGFTKYGQGYGYAGQYGKGYGYAGQYGKGYGYGKYGQESGFEGLRQYGDDTQYGKYAHGYGDNQIAQAPKQLVSQIEYIAKELSAALQSSMLNGQQYGQYLSVHARQFSQIIKSVIAQLEGQGFENVDTEIQQVVYRLREVQVALQRLAVYNTFTTVQQLRTEFDTLVQTAVAQIEKLFMILSEETQGNLYFVIKSVLNEFYNGLQTIYYQIQEVAQGQFGQYGKGYGYGYDAKYGKGYGFGYAGQYGKYAQGYGFGGQYASQYGKGYGYGKYDQGYGYAGQYGKGYGFGKYGSEYGLQGGQYGYGLKTQSCGQLASQIQMVANQVAEELQTFASNDKQIKQVLIIQARELVQIIDNMINRFQVEVFADNVFQQVIVDLRQIKVELQQIVNSGVITTFYQIKAQIANTIQHIASHFEKLALVAQSDLQQAQIVKDVLVQYLVYLRSFQYQMQNNGLGYQYGLGAQYGFESKYGYGTKYGLGSKSGLGYQYGLGSQYGLESKYGYGPKYGLGSKSGLGYQYGLGSQYGLESKYGYGSKYGLGYQYGLESKHGLGYQSMSGLRYENIQELASQLQVVIEDFMVAFRSAHYNPIQAREFAQYLETIINYLQSQYVNKEQGFLHINQVVYKLRQIVDLIHQGSESGVAQINIRLGSYIQDAATEIQNWTRMAQPQLEQGSQDESAMLAMTVLRDFFHAIQYYRETIRAY